MGIAGAGVYLAASFCAPSIVAYVVEETLIQKAPPGTDLRILRLRPEKRLAGCSNKAARLERLLEIAQTLERTQRLTPGQLESALKTCQGGPTGGAH